ncbi:hypothetical protein [Halovenus sp. HT40]|uniref:hypothetical protein n=1 Tax=Halovenus sp. HT40 TaxID=3126691 RepID=UPI00300E98FA
MSWAARWLSLAAYVLGVLVMIAIIPFLTVLLMTAGHLGQFTAVVTVLAVTWWIAYRYRKRAKTLREATTHAQASARQQYLREQQALWNVIKSYAAWTLPIVVATCLFVAARMTGVPRTQIPGTLYTVGLFYTTGIVLLIPYTVIKIFRRDA